MHVFFFTLAYLFALILLGGAFLCLYLGCKLVARSSRAATARSEFSGRLGGFEFSAGAGSIAALVMLISVLWIAAAFMARPKVSFALSDDGGPGWLNVVANVEALEPAEPLFRSRAMVRDEAFRQRVQVSSEAAADAVAAAAAAHEAAVDAAAAAQAAADDSPWHEAQEAADMAADEAYTPPPSDE